MKSKRYFSVAASGLLLIAMGCRTKSNIKSVAVAPDLGVYDYASPGDTLEFTALNPNTQPFYVIFENPSPCVEKYLTVTKDKPGSCKVQPGFNFYRYILSPDPPPPIPSPGKGFSLPKSCPQCQIMIIPSPVGKPGSGAGGSTPLSPKTGVAASNVVFPSSGIAIPVTCNNGVVSVGPAEQEKGDVIFWAKPSDLSTDLTITMPAGFCKATGGSPNVLKELQSCTLDAPPLSTPYSYNVQMSECNKSGTGTLTILDPNTPK